MAFLLVLFCQYKFSPTHFLNVRDVNAFFQHLFSKLFYNAC